MSELFDITKRISFSSKNGKNGFYGLAIYFKLLTVVLSRSGGTHPNFIEEFYSISITLFFLDFHCFFKLAPLVIMNDTS